MLNTCRQAGVILNTQYGFNDMRKNIYDFPEYCYIAYNWPRDYECNFIEQCFKRYLGCKPEEILDIAAGPGVMADLLLKRGYQVFGLDLNIKMARFMRSRAAGKKIKIIRSDMKKFAIQEKFSAAICLMDSFRYLLTDEDILRHFACMAEALKRGGIYIIDFWVPKGYNEPLNTKMAWENKNYGIEVKAAYRQIPGSLDQDKKIFSDQLVFSIQHKNKKFKLIGQEEETAYITRARFVRLIKKTGHFCLLDSFWDFSFSAKINKNTKTNRLIAVLKKTV